MTKRSVYFFLFFLLFVILGIGGYYVYKQSRYNLLASSKNTSTRYPGAGYISEKVQKSILVEPKIGRPFYDSSNNISLYSANFFNVTTVPEHEEMKYVVGNYHSLDDINDGSNDKYLLVRYPTDNSIHKYRISTDRTNELFNNEKTTISYEMYYFYKNLLQAEYDGKNQDIQIKDYNSLFKGKQLVLIPLFDQGLGENKKDLDENYLISKIIIRDWK